MIDFLEESDIKITAQELKYIIDKVSYKNQNAEKVIKKINKEGTFEFEPDTDLRDAELVPLDMEIEIFYQKEILPYIPDAWIDHTKTTKGYEIKFAKYFYNKPKLGEADKILEEIMNYKQEEISLLKSLNS